MLLWYKITLFLIYKHKIKVRRRYSFLDRYILRFKFGKFLFENAHLIILAFNTLGSIVAAISIHFVLQQIGFSATTSYVAWQWFYFILLLFGCLNGLHVTGRVLFPEDTQILARVPLTRKQLPLFVFAEYLSEIILDMFRLFLVPISVPLALATKAYILPGTTLLITILLYFLALMVGFLAALLVRSYRLYILQRSAFWLIVLFQLAAVMALFGASYSFTFYLYGYFGTWLNQIPLDAFRNNEPESIAYWIDLGLIQFRGFTQAGSSLIGHHYWPYNLAVEIIHNGSPVNFGLLTAVMFSVFLLIVLLTSRFKSYALVDMMKISSPNSTDNLVCNFLSRFGAARSGINVILFKNNFMLVQRHLEIVMSGGIVSIFGGVGIWIILGFGSGLGQIMAGAFPAAEQYMGLSVAGSVILLTILQIFVMANMDYLFSVDGEGRNISLLRLAGVSLADLYRCRVKLLRMVTLPAFVTFVLMLGC